ncbi:MAG: LTA synthase family protein [Lachnospiraceae bacterium]|nr:LTA synthase family protein [Lachnospiraceae bacterium]
MDTKSNKVKEIWNDKIHRNNILRFVLLPFLLELVIEMLNRCSVIKGFEFLFTSPVQFFCNFMFIFVSLIIGILVKRRTFYVSFISAIWLIFGITNFVMLNVRVSPFNANDLRLLDAGKAIIDQYFTPFVITLTAMGVILIALVIVVLFIKGPKIDYKINYIRNLIVVGISAAVCIVSVFAAMETGMLARKFTNLTNAYNAYGFVYCFGSGIFNHGVKKPADYSENKIDEILDKIEEEEPKYPVSVKKSDDVKNTPNIVFLQLESFFDITKAVDIEFSQDPIPNFNRLKKEYSSGYLNVFNVGYGTCNTEFESMTSMNLDDFGPGEIPYKSILKTTVCESIAFDLKEYGYRTHAIHNNDGTFYSRNSVFPNLGFDTFTSVEYMNIEERTYEGWAKDKYLTEEILKALKETDDPDYIYTISVQGHGSYPTEKVLEDPEIKVLSGIENEGRRNAIEYYANQIHEMDEFIVELIDALEDYGEDTILVMYGDHLPGLGFTDEELSNGSIYQTEYIIWNNFGLKKEDENLRTYQISPKVMKSLGMTAGIINKYHQEYKDDEDYLSGLQNLEYDILYGDQIAYDGVSPYSATDMKMGIDEISISKIRPVTVDEKDYVEVIGNNFTKYSVVNINGDEYETKFVDSNTLRVKYDNLTPLDAFVVNQEDDDSGTIISTTKECLYYGDDE